MTTKLPTTIGETDQVYVNISKPFKESQANFDHYCPDDEQY